MDPLPESVPEKLYDVIASRNLCRYVGRNERASDTSMLEVETAEFVGCKYAVAFNSCSTAMFVALLCAGVEPGDHVLTPAFTFTAVPSAIVHARAVPVLVECDDDYHLDIDDLTRKAASGSRVLLLSHMRGHISDMDRIQQICDENQILLIEDAAHSMGATWRGTPSGRLGPIGCFSFQSHKAIDAGEGGMLVTDVEEYAVRAILYSGSFERLWECHHIDSDRFAELQKAIPTFGFRMSNVTAAIARAQLPLVEGRIRTFQRNYDLLADGLRASNNIYLPRPDPRASEFRNSIQFALVGMRPEQVQHFLSLAHDSGVPIKSIGTEEGNARAFWNWDYLGETPELPRTRAILKRTCDLRLPELLDPNDIRVLADSLVSIVRHVVA